MAHVEMKRCWASRGNVWGTRRQCMERVPADPDHIGLCERCREELREGRTLEGDLA